MDFISDHWIYLVGGAAFLVGLAARGGTSGTTGDSGSWWSGCDGDGGDGD